MSPSVKNNFYRDQSRSIQKKSEVEKVIKRKIYIEHYHPNQILSKWDELESYFAFSKEHVEISSPYGLFEIDDKTQHIIKIKQQDFPIVKRPNYFQNKTSLLIDMSHYIRDNNNNNNNKLISQIPYEHTLIHYTSFHYCIGGKSIKRSLLYFVVEGFFLEKKDTSKNRYAGFYPTNLFFISDEDIDNVLIKKGLNEFLLMLI